MQIIVIKSGSRFHFGSYERDTFIYIQTRRWLESFSRSEKICLTLCMYNMIKLYLRVRTEGLSLSHTLEKIPNPFIVCKCIREKGVIGFGLRFKFGSNSRVTRWFTPRWEYDVLEKAFLREKIKFSTCPVQITFFFLCTGWKWFSVCIKHVFCVFGVLFSLV